MNYGYYSTFFYFFFDIYQYFDWTTCICYEEKLPVVAYGIGMCLFFSILILVRGFMPIEFYSIGLTKTIYSYRVIPFVKNLFTKNLFVIGPLTITLLKICVIIWGIGAMLHYKHKDFAFKLCMDFLLVIHWWNPLLIRFSFPIMNQLQELLVDYELTQTMRDEQKAQYMQTLTKTLRYSQETLTKPAELLQGHISALADNYTRESILQRIKYIVQQPEKRFSLLGATLSLFLFGASFTVVFEASYMNEKTDDNGNQIYYDIEGQTYYVKNGDSYDLYMQNKYVCTTSDILETFKGVPVYDRLKEVPEDEK